LIVRSSLSAGSRRLIGKAWSARPVGSHALRWSFAVLAAIASVAAGAVAASGAAAGAHKLDLASVSAAVPTLIAPLVGTPPSARAAQYRVVGCRSSGEVDYAHGPSRREVAIGFDDGPYPDTPAFVRMLARNHAQATFFMIGQQVTATYRSTILDELREGDVPGDHTFTHPDLTLSADVRGQLLSTIAAIRAQSGYTPCVFRPPYGDTDARVQQTARSLGLATVTWNVDPSDYLQPGTATIERRVLEQVRPGSIIISHDGGGPRGQTLAAYPSIIATLRARGYRIVTIPQLLGFRPVYVPCIRLCDGIGVSRRQLPRNAILERAR
jgi:peptidoglycan/xylan/chitin deacetylase (PgdA/CDA1 family)